MSKRSETDRGFSTKMVFNHNYKFIKTYQVLFYACLIQKKKKKRERDKAVLMEMTISIRL